MLSNLVASFGYVALFLLAGIVACFLGIHWIRRRSDRTLAAARRPGGGYLGLYLTLGFVVSLTALWVLSGVTADVVTRAPLTGIDVQAGAWLRAHASRRGDRLAMVVTLIGSPAVVALLAALVAVVLAHRRSWIALLGWVAAFVGGCALNRVLKQVIQRPRPLGADAFLFDDSFSYPSAHAMGSLIVYGMLAYLLIARWPWARQHHVRVMLFTLSLVIVIGFSRLYLGVHFLSDVIGGYAAGALWLTICVTGSEIAVRHRGLEPGGLELERGRVSRLSKVA